MSPRHTVLPWDSRTQPPYTLSYKVAFSQFSSLQILFFQVSGGGRVYGYSLQPDSLATVDSDGKVRSLNISSLEYNLQVSVHNGPGKFTVTAGMSGSMHNNHTAQVLLLNPAELELPESLAEWITGTAIQVIVVKAFIWNDQAGTQFIFYLFSFLHFSPGAGCNLWFRSGHQGKGKT